MNDEDTDLPGPAFCWLLVATALVTLAGLVVIVKTM